jgi:MFS family permease
VIVSSPPAVSCAAVLRIRHARRTFGAALLGRLSHGVVFLSLVLSVQEAAGSYAVTGTIMALFGLTSVLLTPARALLIDRYGPRRALPGMSAAYALALTGLAFATWQPGASGTALGLLAVAAGVTVPPLGPVMRTLWSSLVPDRRMLHRAYSLDTVAEELLFVTGPLLVGLLVQVAVPPTGLVVSAVLVLAGSLALVSSPVVRGTRTTTGPKPAQPPRRAPRDKTGLRQAITVSAGVGMCLGALDLLVIAFTDAHHHPEAAAWAMAALSAGSAVGGLAYGAVQWRTTGRARLSLLAAALALTLAATGLSPHPYALIVWAGVAGLFVAPALTTAYLIADDSAAPTTRTRTSAWVNTAFNAGSATAAAGAGLLVGHLPLPACFALAAIPGALSAATGLGRSRSATSATGRSGAHSPSTADNDQ